MYSKPEQLISNPVSSTQCSTTTFFWWNLKHFSLNNFHSYYTGVWIQWHVIRRQRSPRVALSDIFDWIILLTERCLHVFQHWELLRSSLFLVETFLLAGEWRLLSFRKLTTHKARETPKAYRIHKSFPQCFKAENNREMWNICGGAARRLGQEPQGCRLREPTIPLRGTFPWCSCFWVTDPTARNPSPITCE